MTWLDLQIISRIGSLSVWLCLAAPYGARAADEVRFDRDVRPIFSDNCFKCHGPDEKARKADLRFDVKDGAFRVKDGKTVIVPGKSAASELVRRITTTDPDDLMPPPDSNRKLTPQQIETLRRWVDQGATWGKHWALDPPSRPSLPVVQKKNWPRNGIDRFILARLEKETLQPSPEARKETLLRRVTLDLTGLPPTPAEVDTFLADASPDAYEKVVDRLLASPRYGERMAVEWLDLARYADTHGFQMDRYRAVWPYRDWVIKALNEDLPFDQFVTWQLAGDLLPNATKEQRLATAFNRLHLQNEEGGIVEEEYRVAYVVDRVNTFGTAFLGLTLDCSRCHDHKFDPITMRDYYSLFAFFQNIDEAGQTAYFNEIMPAPTLLLSDDATDAKLNQLQRRITEKEKQFQPLREQARGAFAQWLAVERTNTFNIPGWIGGFSFDEMISNKVANVANSAKPASAIEGPKLVPGKFGQAAELDGENGFKFPDLGHFTRIDPFTLSLWLNTPTNAPRFVVLHHSKAPVDAASRGYELLLENGRVAVGLHHTWPASSLKVLSKDALPTNEWVHVAMTYDGSGRAAGVSIFINGKLSALDVVRDGLVKDITYDGGEPDLVIGNRFRDIGFKGGRIDEFRIYSRMLTAMEVRHLAGHDELSQAWKSAPDRVTAEQREGLFDYFVANVYPLTQSFAAALRELRLQHTKLIQPIPEIMVMEETETPKPAHILKRGLYDDRGERVSADTPAVLPPFPAGQPRNRLGLARWLLAPDHPLLARVTVNRAWQMFFGRGLVETSDNLGSQGSFPTHGELLDWLAGEFREPSVLVTKLQGSKVTSGREARPSFNRVTMQPINSSQPWSLKRLHRLIVTSATYRQSSRANSSLLARDPQNQLLARGPARRLTAEMLRDQALAVSGLLAEKIGGPSVKPYQPEGLWEEIAMGRPRYVQGKGEDLHRRSLYTFWKRTVPPPVMMTFDAAEKNVCIVRRQNTSTPLQALALLNDPQIVEAARFVSERMFKEGGATLDDQVAWAFRAVTARTATLKERAVLKELFVEQRALFTANPDAAARLLTVGEGVNDLALPIADLAAGAVLAKAILNHDEAVLRR